MKKDIEIPEVKGVYIAVVKERNKIHNTDDWNAYIVNDKDIDLDIVLIVTHGYTESQTTATFRKKLDRLPKKSYAKIELMDPSVFALDNTFKVSFFEENQLYDKIYVFKRNTINERAMRPIPLMKTKGILVK